MSGASKLVKRFANAIRMGDDSMARALCGDGAWDDPRNSVAHLFIQLTGQARDYQLEIDEDRPSESARAVVLCTIRAPDGEAHGRVALLCDRIPRRIVGWTESLRYAERYLTGGLPPYLDEDDLEESGRARAAIEALAEAIERSSEGGDGSGDDAARARVAEVTARSAGDVIGHLVLMISAGDRLVVDRALCLPQQDRLAIEARLVAQDGKQRTLWLYGRLGDDQLAIHAMTTFFDIDTFLA